MLKSKNIILGFVLCLSIGYFVNLSCSAEQVYSEDADTIRTSYTKEVINLDKEPIMEEYIAKSRKKIKNNWYPPSSSFEKTATIIVTLNKQGQLINCAVSVPSNSDDFDNSLIEAVKKTKFSPLPDVIQDDIVDIDFTFNMQKRRIINK